MTAIAPVTAVRLGVALMLAGMFLFAVNDLMGKWLVATYSVGQVLMIRSLAAIVVLAPFFLRAGRAALLAPPLRPLHALRAALATFEVFAFYAAVRDLPLADVMTYWLAAPIYVAALSPFLLGERVGWRRWTAIAAGFVGVVVALDPSAQALTPAALWSLAGSLAFGLMMVTGRMLRGAPDVTLAFWQLSGALVVGAATAAWGWSPPSALDLGLLALLGVVATAAHMCVTRALKFADAATVTPLQYTLLVWAILLGWLAFGDVPRPAMLAGAAIIVAAGLFIFFRERQAARSAA